MQNLQFDPSRLKIPKYALDGNNELPVVAFGPPRPTNVLCVEGTIMTRTDSAGVVKDMALQQGPGSAGTKIMFSTSLKG